MLDRRTLFLSLAPRRPSVCFAEPDAGAGDEGGAAPAPVSDEPEIDLGDDAPAPVADEAELDIGPDKIKVDKRVKDAWDGMQRTAQEKSENVNKEMQRLAARDAEINERARVFQAIQSQVIEIAGIDQQIAPYEKLSQQDWIAWGQQDATAANNALTALNAMKLRRQQLSGIADAAIKEHQAKESLTAQTRQAEAERAITATFKDWSPQKRETFVKTASEYGFQPTELTDAFRDPRVLSVVQDAMKYRAAVAKAAARPKVAAAADAPAAAQVSKLTPGTPMRANAGGKGIDLSDKTNINDFARNFRKAMKGK